ncbi:MAG: hypothetical protein AAB624_03780 [Patescibacteria group bacterium]
MKHGQAEAHTTAQQEGPKLRRTKQEIARKEKEVIVAWAFRSVLSPYHS